MNQQNRFYMIVALIFLFVIFCIYDLSIEKTYQKELENFSNFQKNSALLVRLKKHAGSKDEKNHSIKRVKQIFQPSKQSLKNGIYVWDFYNLTNNKLDRLGRLLLNSKLIIKSFSIKTVSGKAALHVEFKI